MVIFHSYIKLPEGNDDPVISCNSISPLSESIDRCGWASLGQGGRSHECCSFPTASLYEARNLDQIWMSLIPLQVLFHLRYVFFSAVWGLSVSPLTWLFPHRLQGVEPFDEKTERRKGVFYRRERGAAEPFWKFWNKARSEFLGPRNRRKTIGKP